MLEEISARNKLTNLEIVPLALGAMPGQAFIDVTPGASGLSRIVGSRPTDLVVKVATLDSVVADRTPALIKVDVEGFEFDVLQGGQDTLQRTRCPVVFESPVRMTQTLHQIVEFLAALGYEVFSLDWSGLSPLNTNCHSHNLLALHTQDAASRSNLNNIQIPRNQNN
jgi:hypothetical protein